MLKFSVRFLIKMHCFLWSDVRLVGLFLLVDSLGFERTRKWFVIDIMHLKMSKAKYWSQIDSNGK